MKTQARPLMVATPAGFEPGAKLHFLVGAHVHLLRTQKRERSGQAKPTSAVPVMTSGRENVVQIKDHLPPQPQQQRRAQQKSRYERYPLPFFNRKKRSTWDMKSTGNYTADCATGQAYAIQFLESCDGTVGWACLLPDIVGEMIRAGPSGTFPDGHPKINGIVTGFMRTIGSVLDHVMAPCVVSAGPACACVPLSNKKPA